MAPMRVMDQAFKQNRLDDRVREPALAAWQLEFEIPTVRHLLKDVRSGERILDLNCAGEFYVRDMLDRGASVTGISTDAGEVERFQHRYSQEPRCRFEVAELRSCDDGSKFDVVTGFWALHRAATRSELDALFAGIAGALKPDGRFIGINDNPFTAESIYATYAAYGFTKHCGGMRREGSAVRWSGLEASAEDMETYWWHPMTYRDAAHKAGLEIEFLFPQSASTSVMARDYWRYFIEEPPFLGIRARLEPKPVTTDGVRTRSTSMKGGRGGDRQAQQKLYRSPAGISARRYAVGAGPAAA